MTDDLDFTSYVSARWAQLVHCLIGIGAPPGPAHDGAADTLSRVHDDWDARDDWADIDVHVVRELFDGWDRRKDAWWTDPVPESEVKDLADAGWPEVEAQLDVMETADRRALVLERVVGLAPDQIRDLTGTQVRRAEFGSVPELLPVLEQLPLDPPPIEAVIAASANRRRHRRTISIASALALVLVAGMVALLVVSREEPTTKEGPEQFASVESIAYPNPSPMAWYADGTLFLPKTQVKVRDVREFAQWGDGAVYLDVRGNLVTVTGDGDRVRIAQLGLEATFAVFDEANQVVWVDPVVPELVLYDLETDERVLERELSESASRIVFVEEDLAYLTYAENFIRVDLRDGVIDPASDLRLPGELDRYGPYALTREGGGASTARVRLYDTLTEIPIQLDIEEPRSVSAARFAADGSVMLLVEPPGARVSEVQRCEPPYDECRLVAFFPAGGARSLLPL